MCWCPAGEQSCFLPAAPKQTSFCLLPTSRPGNNFWGNIFLCIVLNYTSGEAQHTRGISRYILKPKTKFGKLCRGGCPQQLAGWDFELCSFRAEQVSSSTPNLFLTDVSTCSFSFYGCDVHLHQLVLSPLSSPHGYCLCTRQDRGGDLQRAEILSASWRRLWLCHSSTVCGWDTASDLPSHLPSASVPFPSQSVVFSDGCQAHCWPPQPCRHLC